MEIRAAEISDVIKQQIAGYSRELEVRETGVVLSCGDGIARIYGLDKAAAGELLQFPHDIFGRLEADCLQRRVANPCSPERPSRLHSIHISERDRDHFLRAR